MTVTTTTSTPIATTIRTLEGLYLFEPIDLDNSFKPSLELKQYMRRATQKEKNAGTERNLHGCLCN